MTNSEFPKGIENVVACLVVDDKDQILLCKHRSNPDKWILPGGHIEVGESIFSAAERETLEEAGLSVKAVRIIDCGDGILLERNKHYIWFCCLLKIESFSEIVKNDELLEAKWFAKKEILAQSLGEEDRLMVEKFLS